MTRKKERLIIQKETNKIRKTKEAKTGIPLRLHLEGRKQNKGGKEEEKKTKKTKEKNMTKENETKKET